MDNNKKGKGSAIQAGPAPANDQLGENNSENCGCPAETQKGKKRK